MSKNQYIVKLLMEDGNGISKDRPELLTIFKDIQEKVNKQCAPYYKKLEKEKDEVRQLKLRLLIQEKSFIELLKALKTLPEKKWNEFIDELFKQEIETAPKILDELDEHIYKRSKDSKEYAKFKKMIKIHQNHSSNVIDIIDKSNLKENQVWRLLNFAFAKLGFDEFNNLQNNMNWFEFGEATNIVKRRFGFDQNWLSCLSLIQLHENLIKKKIVDLGGEIKEDESIRLLISKLTALIREKEKREISLALLLSNGVKTARDILSHEGFKHPVSKKDLAKVYDEIAELEKILYPS